MRNLVKIFVIACLCFLSMTIASIEAASCAELKLHKLHFSNPTAKLDEQISHSEASLVSDAEQIPNNPIRTSVAFYDLNGDGKKEIFARLQARAICANLGCPLIIYTRQGQRLKVLQKFYNDNEIAVVHRGRNGFANIIMNAQFAVPIKCECEWNGKAYDTSACAHITN